MFVRNNLAEPGEIKSVFLYPTHIEVRLFSKEVFYYERSEKWNNSETNKMPGLQQEGNIQSP